MARDIRRALQSEALRRDDLSYYEILGLRDFEQDERKIAEAASEILQRARRLDRTQSARIISRVLQARNTLTNPASKGEYDEQLKLLKAGRQDRSVTPEDAIEALRRKMEATQTEMRDGRPTSPLAVLLVLAGLAVFLAAILIWRAKVERQDAGDLAGMHKAFDLLDKAQPAAAAEEFRRLATSLRSPALRSLAGRAAGEIERTERAREAVRKEAESLLENDVLPAACGQMIGPCTALCEISRRMAGFLDPGLAGRVSARLTVNTVPEGAKVLLGNDDLGVTPLDKRVMPVETRLALVMPARKYESLVLPVRLAPAGALDLSIQAPDIEELLAGEWVLLGNDKKTFTLPVLPDEGSVSVEDPQMLAVEVRPAPSREITLRGMGKPGTTRVLLRYHGDLYRKVVTVRAVVEREVKPPRALVAIPDRGTIYVGFNVAPENQNVTIVRYEILRRPGPDGTPRMAEVGRIPAPQSGLGPLAPPKALASLPTAGQLPKRMFWYTDHDVRGEQQYEYAVVAVSLDAEPPRSAPSETVAATPLYEVDFRLVGGGSGRGIFEVLRWTRKGWVSARFTVVEGGGIGERMKIKDDEIDFTTGYTLKKLETVAGARARLRAVCETRTGREIVAAKDEWRFPESEAVRKEMDAAATHAGKPPAGKPPETTEQGPEVLKPD